MSDKDILKREQENHPGKAQKSKYYMLWIYFLKRKYFI
jgi:hypothetical protein